MIRVITETNNSTINSWPSFKTIKAAMNYIENNTGEFGNMDYLALIDFETMKTTFIRAELKMTFREM